MRKYNNNFTSILSHHTVRAVPYMLLYSVRTLQHGIYVQYSRSVRRRGSLVLYLRSWHLAHRKQETGDVRGTLMSVRTCFKMKCEARFSSRTKYVHTVRTWHFLHHLTG